MSKFYGHAKFGNFFTIKTSVDDKQSVVSHICGTVADWKRTIAHYCSGRCCCGTHCTFVRLVRDFRPNGCRSREKTHALLTFYCFTAYFVFFCFLVNYFVTTCVFYGTLCNFLVVYFTRNRYRRRTCLLVTFILVGCT